jgi:Tol biopolymer transport system component
MHRFQIGLLLSTLLLAACSALPNPFRQTTPGHIAFLGEDGNVYIVDHNGDNQQQVTTNAIANENEDDYRVYTYPIWTRDGQSLAFGGIEGKQSEGAPSRNSLFTVRRDGTELIEAYQSDQFVIYYYWAPDGKRIGLLSQTPGTLALKVVHTDGRAPQTLDTGAPLYWSWAPDSQSVLIHANGEDGRLAVLRLGDDVTEQSVNITPSAFKVPAYSPDGKQMLVAQKSAATTALVLADGNGDDARALAQVEAADIAFVWSPDGQRVAYLAGDYIPGFAPALLSPLTVIDPSGQADPITTEENAYTFFWSPDGKSIAYFTLEAVEDPASGETRRISLLRVLEVSSGETYTVDQIFPSDRFLQMVPYFDQYHQSLTIWSPDSQSLVVATLYDDTQKPGVFIYDATGAGAEPTFVSNGTFGVWSWK